jgi:hypothetical protein
MSTLKSINVVHPSSAVNNIVNDASGNVAIGNNLTVAGTITSTGTVDMGSSFKRNRIINGNMNVAQRGTTFTDGNGYTLDRWYGNRSGGVTGVTYAQVYGAFSTATNSMSIQRTSGNTSTATAVLYQAIEGVNSRDLAGKTITVSFQIGSGSISSTTGHSVIVYYQTTTTDIGPTSGGWTALTAQTFTVASSSSFTQKTFQFSIPSTATQLQLSIQFAFSGTAGADDRFYLTQVQLEQGSVATPYEMQIYSDQLAQCQRYYEIGNFGSQFTDTSATSSYFLQAAYFKMPKRVSPTSITFANMQYYDRGGVAVAFTVNVSGATTNVITAGASGLSNPVGMVGASLCAWTASSEL